MSGVYRMEDFVLSIGAQFEHFGKRQARMKPMREQITKTAPNLPAGGERKKRVRKEKWREKMREGERRRRREEKGGGKEKRREGEREKRGERRKRKWRRETECGKKKHERRERSEH
ncbi:PREDICTED: DEAD-box ATP-dependent RNA helicase 42-like [Nanorana parkeri]|uniref:DEAD-box ATP-dependent RNA helicase 42-like n=1 Tax=Nanorana parkeri TaxID=125878 RepID=UPI000854721A|nr:PREDICTED: DEAD-box ATP-dependent RNA helicase 42-like [Nanorana parkeri]